MLKLGKPKRILLVLFLALGLIMIFFAYGFIQGSSTAIVASIVGLTTDKIYYMEGEPVRIEAGLKDSFNSSLPFKFLSIYVNDFFMGRAMTDAYGNITHYLYTPFMEPESYYVRLVFEGEEIVTNGSSVTYGPSEAVVNFTIAAAASNVSSNLASLGIDYKKSDRCYTETWQEEEAIVGNCSWSIKVDECIDPPLNLSCHARDSNIYYPCETGRIKVNRSRVSCKPSEIIFTHSGKTKEIFFGEWGNCSIEENADSLIIVCDSKYDGNGDGICHPGESCVKYVITEKNFQTLIKNSASSFASEDSSFFLERPPLFEVGSS
ncbi:hypothetical protein HYU13_02900 [Candidatus Woesearchaeota archaeon]|nr:hypothetical protein [Candidatus Woesearchaeota archaeon]